MKINIQGIIDTDDPSHKEFVIRFMELLRENGMVFVGETKIEDK